MVHIKTVSEKKKKVLHKESSQGSVCLIQSQIYNKFQSQLQQINSETHLYLRGLLPLLHSQVKLCVCQLKNPSTPPSNVDWVQTQEHDPPRPPTGFSQRCSTLPGVNASHQGDGRLVISSGQASLPSKLFLLITSYSHELC